MVPHAEQSLKNSRFVLYMRGAGKDMAAALELSTSKVTPPDFNLRNKLLSTLMVAFVLSASPGCGADSGSFPVRPTEKAMARPT